MNIEYFFPTAIYSEKLQNLAVEILPVVKKQLENKDLLTYHWGYKTTFQVESGLELFSELSVFKDLIIDRAKLFLHNQGYEISNAEFTVQIFASDMTVNDSHGIHTHPNALISGVFYLDVEENSAPIVFYDPRPFRKFLALPRNQETIASYEKVMFVPISGLLLLWESWLEHEVPKNQSKKRITLVFNLGKK
jgi:uncharacterized protein (TIGR02466 family)